MTYMPRFNRRSFMVGATAAGAGFALGLSLPSAVRCGLRRRWFARSRRLGGDPARRDCRYPYHAVGNGPRLAHRPRATGCRGARLRLVESHDRISDARREFSHAIAYGANRTRPVAARSVSPMNMSARAARPRG